jgi:ketosteroid isomerase-like protein
VAVGVNGRASLGWVWMWLLASTGMSASGGDDIARESANAIAREDVLAFMQAYVDASNSYDFANVSDLIHPQAVFRFTSGDNVGIEAIQAAFERTWAYDVEDEAYELSDVQVVHTDVDTAVVTFRYHWSGVGPRGPFRVDGRGTSIVVRDNGALKVMVEHLSR